MLLTLFQEPPCLVNTSSLNVTKWTSPLTPITIQPAVSPILTIIHSTSLKPTGYLVAPPSKSIQHLTTVIQASWCFTHIIRVPSLTRFLLLLPLKCALHTPARGSLLRKKLDGVILKSFTRSISKSTHNGTQVSTWDSPLIFWLCSFWLPAWGPLLWSPWPSCSFQNAEGSYYLWTFSRIVPSARNDLFPKHVWLSLLLLSGIF